MARHSTKVQLNVRAMRVVTGANRLALCTRQARDRRNRVGELEPSADEGEVDTREIQGLDMEREVTMSETNAEIEMGATASND
jgi:hypothetical protein